MCDDTKDIEHSDLICEAAGCFTKAIVEIEVPLGREGTLLLNLCENCLPKFREENHVATQRSDEI